MAIKTGLSVADLLYGTATADTIFGAGGDDIAFGGGGDDVAFGGNNNDTLYGANGVDTLNGDAGDDVAFGGIDNDRLFGGDGNDILVGDDGADTIDGGNGNDILRGEEGNDRLFGGGQDDTLYGGGGADYADAGAGNDQMFLGVGADTAVGGTGDDVIDGEDGADTISGDAGADTIYGSDGNDSLAGGDAADSLFGGYGNDSLSGGDGDDSLSGGLGNDFLYGGAGYDSAIFGGSLADATITGTYGGTMTVISDEGRDILVSIENISFTGGENGPPVITSYYGADDHELSVAENTSGVIADVDASDPDLDPITYAISGGADATLFTVDSDGKLSFLDPPDFEGGGDNSYEVVVRASDDHGNFDEQTFTVDVTDANEAPVIAGGDNDTLSFAENDTDPVTTVAATDPDSGDQVTYSLDGGDDAGFFTIDPTTGVLSFIDPPDFEDPQDSGTDNSYVVIVKAEDSSGLFDEQTITVNVTDVADGDNPPVIGGGDNDTVSFAENDTDPVTTVAATDPDGGDQVTYSLDGGDDAGFFTIDPTTGVLSFIDPPDFEDPQDNGTDNSYVVIVKAEDSSGLFDEQTITVDVTDANEAPVIGGGDNDSVSFAENDTVSFAENDTDPVIGGGDNDSVSFAENDTDPVTTVAATDPDAGDQVTYSLDGGDDAGFFTIDPTTGVLSFIDSPDFEDPQDSGTDNSYVVIVKAEDSSGLFDEQTITVDVTDANEAPVIGGGDNDSVSFAENDTDPVTTVAATDPDAGDQVTYSLDGGDDVGFFTIDPTTGVLSFIDPPDFEDPQDSGTDNSYVVVVKAEDSSGLFDEQTITVDVTDANEAPVIVGGDNDSFSFAENDTDPVTTVSATDPDAGDQVTYSLDGGDDAGFFTIDPSSGALSFIDPPDFENPQDYGGDNSYVVVVKAEDSSGLFDEQTITVDVTDVIEGPGADPNDHDDVDGGTTVSGSATTAADTIYGSSADNNLTGGNNNDLIYGGLGNDTIDGGNDNDRLFGGEGSDTLVGSNNNDTIYGDSGNDSIDGANGNDFLYGGSGDDSILGGHEDDVFIGGYGHDTLNGLVGSDGNDTFAYLSLNDAGDTIIGFDAATDVIAFSAAAFAAPGWTAGNALPAGDFGTYFTYTGGVLSYDADGAGGGSAIVIATLSGAPALTEADLFLF